MLRADARRSEGDGLVAAPSVGASDLETQPSLPRPPALAGLPTITAPLRRGRPMDRVFPTPPGRGRNRGKEVDPLDEGVVPIDPDFLFARRSRGIAWLLVLVATVTGSIFVTGMMRPEVIARTVASVRAYLGPTRSVPPASLPAEPPLVAATPRVLAVPASAKASTSAMPEPPLVSVWSLPVARVAPASPTHAFRVPAAPLPPRALLAPGRVSASNAHKKK